MPDMATPGTKPSSALLQDLLREKKAQSQRAKKTHDAFNGQKNGLDGREVQSSPIAAISPRDRLDAHSRRDSGVGIRKEMGLKEMQEHISKMSKQNFNLKLEVHYCREKNKTLETKLEKFKEREADNRELHSMNVELMAERETRIVAIDQAVDVICEREATIEELEAKNKELEMAVVGMDFSRSPDSSDAEPAKEGTEVIASTLSTVSGTELSDSSRNTGIGVQTDQQPLSEHSLSAPDTLSPPKPSARRIPSFMRDNKKSTTVLRSLYSSGNPSFVSLGRPISMLSDDDDDNRIDRQMSNSPPLSILSESGFESIYGGPKDQTSGDTDGEDNVAEPRLPEFPSNLPQRNAQSQLRLRRWLDEKNMARTPSPKGIADDRVSSIGEVLSQAPAPSQDRNATAIKVPDYPREQRTPEKRRNHEKRSSSPSFAGPIFGAAILPPTPDTMSTATLNASSSTASIITEKSLLDYPAKAHSALLLDTRPQSSQSGNGSPSAGSLRDTARPSMSAQSHTRGISGSDTARRPSLAISGADSGGSSSTTQASRTLSYPSPTSRTRRFSGQRSPQSYRGSDSNSDKTVDQSPQERLRSGSAATIMPTRRTARDDYRSPLSSQEATAPSPITALPHLPASPPRSSSLRSKIVNRFSRSSANNATRIPNPSSKLNDTTPSRPPVTRAPASIQHARLPRPASLYGQHPDFNFSPSPTYELKSMIPYEEDMLTSLERYSAGSSRNVERGRDRVRK